MSAQSSLCSLPLSRALSRPLSIPSFSHSPTHTHTQNTNDRHLETVLARSRARRAVSPASERARGGSGVQAAAHVGGHITNQDYQQFHQLDSTGTGLTCQEAGHASTLTPSQPQPASSAPPPPRRHHPATPSLYPFVPGRTPRPFSFTTQNAMSYFPVLIHCRVLVCDGDSLPCAQDHE